MSDSIHLNNIRAFGYTGALVEEQTLGQWYQVDLTLRLDTSTAGRSDRLEDTYDYTGAVAAVQKLVKTAKFHLIEALAANIADIMLASGRVEQVQVKLTKLHPPIPDFTGSVSVEIIRDRQA